MAVGLAAACSVLFAQDRAAGPTPLVTLRGVVVSDDGTDAPIRRIRVEVSAAGLSADPTFTDDQGRFIVSVPDGSHVLTFSKPGFARQELHRSTAAGDELLTLRMPRGAAIAGRVVDEFGDPILARVRIRGRDREAIVDSDPLGEFRAGSLPAGRYEVAVQSGFGSLAEPHEQRPPTFVDLGAGEVATVSLTSAAVGQAAMVLEAARNAVAPSPAPGLLSDGSAALAGRVTGPSGLPVGGAIVTSRRERQPDRSVMTDTNGRFVFDGLSAGTVALSVRKIGPSLMDTVRDVRIVLRKGQVVDDVALTMERNPAIEGVVTDEYGEPVEGVTVELWHRQSRGGRALLAPVGHLTTIAKTDDRGHYRLLGSVGTSYVVATDRGAAAGSQTVPEADGALRVYYPGTATLADALPLRVERGRDVAGIDITFAARVTGRIQGFAFDASGRPLTEPVILMDSYRSGAAMTSPRRAPVDVDGRFSFVNVPPGDHVLHAIVRGGGAAEFAMTHVTVSDGDAAPVVVRTAPGTTLTGRIVLESSGDRAFIGTFGLSAQAADWDYLNLGREASRALTNSDGTFELSGLHGPMRVTATLPEGVWWLKSVNIGAVDVAEQPFVFGGGTPRIENVVAVFADTAGEIQGRVVDRGERLSQYAVLVFSTERHRWWASSGHVRLAQPDPEGRFRALALPPGEYFAAAVDRFDLNTDPLDADILAELAPAARRVTLRERQQVTIELDLIRRFGP
jgi:hypothetical protein